MPQNTHTERLTDIGEAVDATIVVARIQPIIVNIEVLGKPSSILVFSLIRVS